MATDAESGGRLARGSETRGGLGGGGACHAVEMTNGRQVNPTSRRAVLAWGGGLAGAGALAACSPASGSGPALPTPSNGRPTTPPPMTVSALIAPPGFIVAHRGGARNWPEMTEVAYAGATKAGVRALEVSVHRSADGVFVCCHDDTTSRVTGVDKDIASTAWSELSGLTVTAEKTTDPSQPRAAFTRLDTVLDAHAASSVIVLEDKSYTHGDDLVARVRELPDHQERVLWKVHGPSGDGAIARGRDAGLRTFGYFFPNNLDGFADKAARFDVVGIDVTCTDEQVQAAVDLGKPVLAHVLRTTVERDRMLALGCRGLMVADVLALTPP